MGVGKKEQILITVRTYPMPSARHIELVCTAGITDQEEWRRLYPVPHRYLQGRQQYRTYDVIELEVARGKDNCPETRTANLRTLRIIDRIDCWDSRSQWVNPTVFPSLDPESTLQPSRMQRILQRADSTANHRVAVSHCRRKLYLQVDLPMICDS